MRREVSCPRCGKSVDSRGLSGHLKFGHGEVPQTPTEMKIGQAVRVNMATAQKVREAHVLVLEELEQFARDAPKLVASLESLRRELGSAAAPPYIPPVPSSRTPRLELHPPDESGGRPIGHHRTSAPAVPSGTHRITFDLPEVAE